MQETHLCKKTLNIFNLWDTVQHIPTFSSSVIIMSSCAFRYCLCAPWSDRSKTFKHKNFEKTLLFSIHFLKSGTKTIKSSTKLNSRKNFLFPSFVTSTRNSFHNFRLIVTFILIITWKNLKTTFSHQKSINKLTF